VSRPARTRLAAAAVAVSALVLSTGCAARFERPQAGDPAVVDAGGDPGSDFGLGPGLGLPEPSASGPGAPGGSAAPGAPGSTTGPGATAGPGDPPGGGQTGQPTAGPSRSGSSSTVAAGRRTGISDTTIKLAYLIPKTGAAAVPPQVEQGIRAYWDWLRGRGGVVGRNVQVTTYDTESNEQVARERAQQAIDDDNFAVVALDRLGVQGAIGDYLDARGVPNLMVQTPVNLPRSKQWTFGLTIDHGVQGRLIAQYFRRALGYTTAAVIYETDNTLRPGVAAFKDEAKKLGLQVVYESQVDGNANDFSAQVSGLQANDPQAAWLYMAPIPAGKLGSQADAVGVHPTWFANSISWNFDLIHGEGAVRAFRGARGFSPWPPLSDPRTATYRQAYQQLYSDPPLDLGIPGWGIGQIIASALTNAGSGVGQNSFRHAMQNLRLAGTSPVDKTPLLWSPVGFGPGVRTGADQVITLKESGGRWVLESDYKRRY
jgi:branched-chain amino acid transport system substrate-binding protein